MESSYAGDAAFFDSEEEDQGPNLKGEYNRGTTPPSHRSAAKQSQIGNPSAGSSTTSGHYSSDSNMSKTKETPSRDAFDSTFSRARSPSARTRTPSGSSHRYSDSFDSEDSGDSRSGSPTRSRRAVRKGNAGDSGRRFDSGTSRDSRPSTFRSVNSSGYGRTNKKGPQKTQQKKGRGRGRANSNASSAQNTPRGGNETTRRMLSAKGHTINRIRNEYEVLKSKHDELQREFKLQKELHRKNNRELDRYTKQEESLPTIMKSQNSELEHYRKKCQAYRDKERQKDQQLKQYNDKLNRTEDELKRARNILENKGLKERSELQKERDGLEEKLQEKERKLEDLEKYLKNVKKNQRYEKRDWKSCEREYKGQIEHLNDDNEKLQLQLREKEKELEIKNIYSNRIVKPPGRLRTTSMSPNSLRPMMIHKSTTTDEIKLSPKAPVDTRRASSADDAAALDSSRFKSPREDRYKRKAEEQRQKSRERTEEVVETKQEERKELSEHERILMDLDSGVKKPEEKKPSKVEEDDDETMRILRQLDSNSVVKGNSQRQPTDEERRREEERKREEKRRQEEAERRNREEEERRRKEEENKKPQWLKGPTTTTTNTTSSSVTSSTGYTPSAFSSNTAPMRGPVAARVGAGQTQQHKAATSKLPWLAANSPVHKPEQERKEKEELEANISNGVTNSPRQAPTLNTSEDEEDYPFFGSKPANNTKPAPKATNKFAVQSVKDLQKYSAARASPTDGRSAKEREEQEAKEAEERHRKDLLLARMRDIDDGKKPDSGKSQRTYNHTDPVKNMHNGLPSHPEVNKQRRKSIEDDLTFGSYAPSFTNGATKPAAKGPAKKKNPFFDNDNDSDSGFKLSPKHSPQRAAKKNSLMADLFGNGSDKSDSQSRSSFGEETIFSSSTKAKPVADSGVYPWEKKVEVGQGNGGNKPKNGGLPPQKSYSDDFDDDIEEMTL
ncbi:uncharacterized protein [Amphiura filiformis]|uniref:uncharacterized protein isoform X2 n=1 Tax=Amphiura filiformis TaxID=82378 RepID=UPI003B227AE3